MQLLQRTKSQAREQPLKKYMVPPFLKEGAHAPSELHNITKRTPSQILGDLLEGIKTKKQSQQLGGGEKPEISLPVKPERLERTDPPSEETQDADQGSFSLNRPGNLSLLRREL